MDVFSRHLLVTANLNEDQGLVTFDLDLDLTRVHIRTHSNVSQS